MKKLIKDGKVAVLYSTGFGAGWYTWNNNYPEILFDPEIVSLVEQAKFPELEEYISVTYPKICNLGMDSLQVQWLPAGTEFKINEYDGAESIELKEADDWITA